MLRAIFCLESLGLGIQVDVTLICITHLRTVADSIHPLMAMVLPDDRGLFQQDNAPCHTATIVQDGLRNK